MRIVITKNGKFFVKEFKDEEDFTNNDTKPNNHKLHYNNSSSTLLNLPNITTKNYNNASKDYHARLLKYRETFHIGNNKRSNSFVSKKVLENYFNRDESKINIDELNKAKKLVLTKKRINISQAFLNKYDLDTNYQKKLDGLSNTLRTRNDYQSPNSNSQNEDEKEENEKNDKNEKEINKNNNFISLKNPELNPNIINSNNNIIDTNIISENGSLTMTGPNRKIILGEIISKDNFINLSKDVTKFSKGLDDYRIPLDDNNVNSFNFRSKYENKRETMENLDLLVNFPINSDKTNLIKYFNQKKSIAPFYFKNLLRYDELQMYKLNKICKVLLDKKENEFRENKKKEENNYNKDKTINQKSKENLESLARIMKKTNGILDVYLHKIVVNEKMRKEDYEYVTSKFKQKYWDKYDVDRFLKLKEKMVLHPELFKSSGNFGKPGFNVNTKLKANNSTPNLFEFKSNAK